MFQLVLQPKVIKGKLIPGVNIQSLKAVDIYRANLKHEKACKEAAK